MLNIAMISGWHVHARDYAGQINKSGIAKVTAVWDEIEERGRKWAEELSAEYRAELDDILSDPQIDGVAINAPTNMHPEIMLKATAAKKNIFTEKVMALHDSEAEKIAAAVKDSGIIFQISYPHRTDRRNIYLKKMLESGVLGKPTLLRIRNAHNGTQGAWLPKHFYDKAQCGGGAMIDLGAHGMYLSHWFLGDPVSVMSMFTNVFDVPVEDNAVSVIEYKDGAIAINETGFDTPVSPYSVELYGTNGAVVIGDSGVKVKSSAIEGAEKNWLTVTELPDGIDSAILNWLKSIKGEAEPQFTIDDAAALTKLMDGAYRSHEEKRKVFF